MTAKQRRYLQAFIQTLIIFLGNTVAIWLTFFLIQFFKGINEEIAYPGILSFVSDGTILIITFSFLTTILIATTNKFKANFYNISSLILILITSIIYAKFTGLGGEKETLELWRDCLLWLPFLVSTILMFFALKNQRSVFRQFSWLKGAKSNSFDYSVFIAFAIAGNKTAKKREDLKTDAQNLETELANLGYSPAFNAANYFSTEHDYQPADIAAKEDFTAIENCRNFLLYYPEAVATSALIELGYALRDRDNIVIATKNKNVLPFLARGLSDINENVRVIECNDINHLVEILKENHKDYLLK